MKKQTSNGDGTDRGCGIKAICSLQLGEGPREGLVFSLQAGSELRALFYVRKEFAGRNRFTNEISSGRSPRGTLKLA